jgi:glycosyltransferase involved in cell wall biosynthesis
MSTPRRADDAPRFSIVSAVYNVSGYLEEFIASIEAQETGLHRLEVIMVDDGSTDDSLAILEAWQRRRPELVTVLHKANGGQASARNIGLDHARGEWVTFTDPDDMLGPNVLGEVEKFLSKYPQTELVALSRVIFHEGTERRERHPLHKHFGPTNRLRDLDKHPDFFYGSAPCAFFRREVIEREGLRFSELIRPNFEDGYFCDVYLLRVAKPLVGFVATAEYLYRRRSDNSSTLNQSRVDARRYTTVPEHGYLGLLDESVRSRGVVPEWIQNHLIYELSWYFSDEDAQSASQTAAYGDVAVEFHRLLGLLMERIDPEIVRTFALRRMTPIWRETLLHGYRPEPWHTPFVVVDKFDIQQNTVRVTYRFTHDRPTERFFVDGVATEPLHEKVCALPYFDRALIRERIVWLPFGSVRVELDGQDMDVRTEEPEVPVRSLGAMPIRQALDSRLVVAAMRRDERKMRRSIRDRATTRLARTKVVRRVYRQAWVLMDRIHDADDSAEHLFRHLRKHEPKVNAWFVIETGTPGHKRLRRDGYYRRVVPHGSLRWKLVMINCTQYISSHADIAVSRPPAITALVEPSWRFTFLQHGVIKDDLARWLNPKDVDIFVASTKAEYHSIADDDTSYRYTSREVQLTGLPRFDRVLAAGKKFPPARRDLILIAPTWRNWLVSLVEPGTQRWGIDVDRFRKSDFAQNWLGVLVSDELAALAKNTGTKIGLLMHPNLQSVAPALNLPSYIETFGFENTDVRETFARARVLVTDYSSMAFNAAYIERPIVYFQFDRERMLTGGHIGRRGYFDYERDGFGPVTFTPDDALKAIADVLEYGAAPRPQYLERIEDAFPMRDGRCCERVVTAIKASSRDVWTLAAPASTDPAAAAEVALDPTSDDALIAQAVAVDEAIARAGDAERPEPGADPAADGAPVQPLASDAT